MRFNSLIDAERSQQTVQYCPHFADPAANDYDMKIG